MREKIRALPQYLQENIGVDGYLRIDFDTPDPDQYESHDIAWDIVCDAYEKLSEVGLSADLSSDHDTVWGQVFEVNKEEIC